MWWPTRYSGANWARSLGNLLQQSAYGLVSRAGHSLSPAAEEWQRLLLEQDQALPAIADQ